jgi:ribosome-associated protein YbcJ (S4-like RNA binding protein)
MEKFKEAKAKAKDGQVDIDKLVEKRRKHKASKQHKFMPNI